MSNGDRVMCWGIPGGPFKGRIVRKGISKDCWVCRVRIGDGIRLVELNEDYIRRRLGSAPVVKEPTNG